MQTHAGEVVEREAEGEVEGEVKREVEGEGRQFPRLGVKTHA